MFAVLCTFAIPQAISMLNPLVPMKESKILSVKGGDLVLNMGGEVGRNPQNDTYVYLLYVHV